MKKFEYKASKDNWFYFFGAILILIISGLLLFQIYSSDEEGSWKAYPFLLPFLFISWVCLKIAKTKDQLNHLNFGKSVLINKNKSILIVNKNGSRHELNKDQVKQAISFESTISGGEIAYSYTEVILENDTRYLLPHKLVLPIEFSFLIPKAKTKKIRGFTRLIRDPSNIINILILLYFY